LRYRNTVTIALFLPFNERHVVHKSKILRFTDETCRQDIEHFTQQFKAKHDSARLYVSK